MKIPASRQASAPPSSHSKSKPRVVRLRSLGSVIPGSPEPASPESGSLEKLSSDEEPASVPSTSSKLRHDSSELSVLSADSAVSLPLKTLPENEVLTQLEQGVIPDVGLRRDSQDGQLPRAISERLLDELEKLHNAHTLYESVPKRQSVLESL